MSENPVTEKDLDAYDNGVLKHTFRLRDYRGRKLDITSHTAVMEIRDTSGGTLYYSGGTAESHISLDEINSYLYLQIPADVVAAWPFTTAEYDIFLTPPEGVDYGFPVVRGTVTLYPAITEPVFA